MIFNKKTWKNREVEFPGRRTLTPAGENVYDVARNEGLILEEGDAFDAKTMNELENRIGAGMIAVAPLYTATYLLDGWTEADEDAKGRGYNWTQTVQLVPDDNDAPAVTAESVFVTTASYLPTGVVSTDEVLDEALSIIDGGYTTSGAGTVTTLVVDKPTADIPVRWAIRPGVM